MDGDIDPFIEEYLRFAWRNDAGDYVPDAADSAVETDDFEDVPEDEV